MEQQRMAAYAAVVSLMHLMEQIQLYHNSHPIFLQEHQMQLQSLAENVSFLQDFLERYSCEDNNEAESLESRIVDAAYAAEDAIESYIVDDIRRRQKIVQNKNNKVMASLEKIKQSLGKFASHMKKAVNRFSHDIQKVIECIDTVKGEVLEFTNENRIRKYPKQKEPEQVGSLKILNVENDTVVGFNGILNSIMDKLTAQKSDLQVVAITGMGGSGKSTLAKTVYDDRFTKEQFDICAWVTVSQEFNGEEVLLALLRETGGLTDQTKPEVEGLKYHELGEKLHKHLFGRRFFIVIDDIWSFEALDQIKKFLQNSDTGSRVVITTRLSNLANNIGSFHIFKMNLLDENESWSLLRKKVFGQESCPSELEEFGKVIAKNCRGLPLSIVVIGGLLRKSIQLKYWEYIASNTSATVNSEENERCLKILYMSYNHLPVHLKPCFLFLSVFPEDHDIRVGELIKLWVSERFLKLKEDKTLEEVAGDYLKDLIDSNLIFVTKLGCTGNVKRCKIHDLLRDLCMREATKNKFIYVRKMLETSQSFHCRRLSVCDNILHRYYSSLQFRPLEYSSSFLRSLICNFELYTLSYSNFKLLSVLKLDKCYLPEVTLKLVNSRYLDFTPRDHDRSNPPVPGSVNLLWNLQTFTIRCDGVFSLPSEIWEMSQLRHVIISEFTLDGPCAGKSDTEENIVLENLQTLSCIHDFRCSEEVLQKIPNLRKLAVLYLEQNFPFCYLKNLGRLKNLESLKCKVPYGNFLSLSALDFSLSLRKLDINVHCWEWKDIGEKIGLLPHLEKFSLQYFSGGKEWYLVDGQFPCLKYLFMAASGLVHWTVDNTPFPCLEHLCLFEMQRLENIPSEIGDIPTLQSLKVCRCSKSAAYSAEMIQQEQRSLGNEDLLVSMVENIYD